MSIYVVGALICFAVAYRTFFVKKKPTQSRKLFGLLSFLFGLICVLDFLAQVAGTTKLSMYLQDLMGVVYPFPMFLFMLIPLTIYKDIRGKTILKIMVLPLLVGLFSFIGGGGGCTMDVEAGNFEGMIFVKFIYNEDIYSIWLLLNFIPVVVMYYLFYKIFKTPDVRANKDSMKRLKVFVTAFTILIIAGYAFAIAEMIFGTPPLSSVGAAVGVSLAMIAFKLRKETM
ncbi:MAG: hypothetical protein A7316_03665 [Candidatus Altiarchaeales archaeon WOR_SM1_86-2]|nr:MAG: hypothetical protein A7316_03665 [Candidatus Altiarchaeales archaeon WOR_SM1_86-2]